MVEVHTTLLDLCKIKMSSARQVKKKTTECLQLLKDLTDVIVLRWFLCGMRNFLKTVEKDAQQKHNKNQ